MDKECTVFVINVTELSAENLHEDYLQNAKELVKNMIEKLIFITPKSEAGIILTGIGNDSNSPEMYYQAIQTVSWDMVEKVEQIQNVEISVSWLAGLQAALNDINDAFGWKKLKVVLISYFPPEALQRFDNLDNIAEIFQMNQIELICCGPENLMNSPEERLNNSEQKILEFCKKAKGWYRPFDSVLKQSRFYESGRTRFCPWNCNLEIHTIKIPVRVAVKVSKNEMKKPWSLVSIATEDGIVREAPMPIGQKKELVDRTKTVHEIKDTIKGYMCGKTFIPVTEDDEKGMELPYEETSFKLYGVTKPETVLFRYRTGPSTWLVLPQEGHEDPFFYFLKIMKQLNLVGLVRRIYNNGAKNPTMNILTPCTENVELPMCFIMHQLIFAEEECRLEVQSLDPVISNLTKKEQDVVGELIDSMLVGNNGEESTEQFTRAPHRQHLWNIKAFRALHPDEPIPPLKDYLMASLEPPKSVSMAEVNSCVEQLINLFEITPEEVVQVVAKETDMEVEADEPEDNLQNKNLHKLPANNVLIDKNEDIEERACMDLDDMFEDS
ncbi:X-ray repair cross-complementing protein 5-like isoform X2 [Diachasmimorpha longicaudata]|uniref:X-ray repair cross-complementing protein 5-like isoform X2 n=1 Tax=Diachasmimorpha longicaudata TaxID=58733 RepID=UPI0030B89664